MALKLSHFCKPRAALLSRAVSSAHNRTTLLGSTYTVSEGEVQAHRCTTSLLNRTLRESVSFLHVLGDARVHCLHARVCVSKVDQAPWESGFGVFRRPSLLNSSGMEHVSSIPPSQCGDLHVGWDLWRLASEAKRNGGVALAALAQD